MNHQTLWCLSPATFPTLWSWPPSDLPMFWATVAAAAVVLWYACLTRRSVKNTWTANQAGLLKQILEEHAELAEDRKAVKNWWREDPATAITRYETELKRLQK